MLREHRGLAILFAAIALGCAAYGWRAMHQPVRRAQARAPASDQPIYIEAVPDEKSP